MNNDNLKWLAVGIAGSLLVLISFFGGIFYLYFSFLYAPAKNAGHETEVRGEPVYGPDAWVKKQEEYNKKKSEAESLAAASGLSERYTVVEVHDDTRVQLHENHDFVLVVSRLKAQFDAADSPLAKHRYSQHIRFLGRLRYNEDPEALLATLNQFVDTSPDLHWPYLIRGCFQKDYAWYFRGYGPDSQVTEEGRRRFLQHLDLARIDLEKSFTLEPRDIEATALMIPVAAGLDLGIDALDTYYQKTLAVNPLHHEAHAAMVEFLQPQWGGSYEAMNEIANHCWDNLDSFPLLAEVIRTNNYYQDPDSWNSYTSMRRIHKAYYAQNLESPGDLQVLACLAGAAMDMRDFEAAVQAFQTIGDRFPVGSFFDDIPTHNKWRAIAYAECADEAGSRGTGRERSLLEEAIALDPANTAVAGLYLGFLAREKDDARTKDFYQNLKDPYLVTGNWGNPPDYSIMVAMAKAGRSDDWGVGGTEREWPLLEEALALAPENAYVRLICAEYHINRDQFDAAEEHLTKARELDPGYVPALHIMGWLHFHQKRWDAAIATANEFLAMPPSPYLARYTSDAREIIDLCEKKKGGG